MTGFDPNDFLNRLAEHGKRMRFARGVLGKTANVAAMVAGGWLIILCRLSENLILDAIMCGVGLTITAAAAMWMWWIKNFAIANPALAVLEGLEVLEYQRFEAQLKGLGKIESAVATQDPEIVLSKDITDEQAA